MVFLHAFPLNAEMWVPQLRAMPEGWSAVAPDFRGFGGSDPDDDRALREDARLEDYAADVAALLDALGAGARRCADARWAATRRSPCCAGFPAA